MRILKNFPINGKHNKSIITDLYFNQTNKQKPLVIFCHGYKGYKDWGAFDLMSSKFLKAGLALVKFNFSHNGCTLDQPIDFPDLVAFGNNNYTKELDDLNDVIDWVQNYFKSNLFVNSNNICLLGHSRGGGICILKASRDQRIKKVITLASVCDFKKRTKAISDLKDWKKTGVAYVLNRRTHQKMPHFYQFYEDLIANSEALNIEAATKQIQIPQLIIHGDSDSSVSIEEAQKLHIWNPKSELRTVKNANHVFNTKHPWDFDIVSPEFFSMICLTVNFIMNKHNE